MGIENIEEETYKDRFWLGGIKKGSTAEDYILKIVENHSAHYNLEWAVQTLREFEIKMFGEDPGAKKSYLRVLNLLNQGEMVQRPCPLGRFLGIQMKLVRTNPELVHCDPDWNFFRF